MTKRKLDSGNLVSAKSGLKRWGGEQLWAHAAMCVGKILDITPAHILLQQYQHIKDETIIVVSDGRKIVPTN